MGRKRSIEATDTERRSLELRIGGASFDEIAKEIGYDTASGAWKAYQRALKATLQEPAAELRRLECERLDRLFRKMYEIAVNKGSPRHAEVALKAMEQRAKLLGLDAPARHRVNIDQVIDQEIRRLEGELAANDPTSADAGVGVPGQPGEAREAG